MSGHLAVIPERFQIVLDYPSERKSIKPNWGVATTDSAAISFKILKEKQSVQILINKGDFKVE